MFVVVFPPSWPPKKTANMASGISLFVIQYDNRDEIGKVLHALKCY